MKKRIYCQIAWGRAKRIVLFITVEKPTYKENLNRVGTFGMPDNIVIEDGRITIVEEAKMWSKRDFERLARLAKNDPVTFLDRGFQSVKGGDKRQTRYIQLKKHKKAVEYLLANLDKFPDAKKYGISRAGSDIVYMLKVPKWAPDDALETMRNVFEEQLNIKVAIRKINWGGR